MKALMFSSLLLTLCSAQATAGAPESILGTWHLDMVRTMSEHIDRIAQERPELFSAEAAQAQKAALEGIAEQASAQNTLTVTADTITFTNPTAGVQSTGYRVIGGNSALVIVEATDSEGYQAVMNIRLIDSGIALETTDCRQFPERCRREQQRAMQRMRSQGPSTNTASVVVTGESVIDGNQAITPPDDFSQPRWVYFRPKSQD